MKISHFQLGEPQNEITRCRPDFFLALLSYSTEFPPISCFLLSKSHSKSCYFGFSKSFENCQVWLATKIFNSIEKNQKCRLKPLFFIPPTPLTTLFFFSFLFCLILCFLLSYLPSSMFFYPHKQ